MSSEIDELRQDLHDLVIGVDGVAFQLERIVHIMRILATRELGDDPLHSYYDVPASEARVDLDETSEGVRIYIKGTDEGVGAVSAYVARMYRRRYKKVDVRTPLASLEEGETA